MSLGPLYVFLREVSVQVLCPFFNWVVYLPGVSRVSSLYILEIRPLSEVSLANMFSHTVGSLLILMLFSLAMQKLFYFDEVPFVYSFLYVPCFRGCVYEDVAAWNVWDFPANVFLKDFYGVTTYIYVFYPSWVYFRVWHKLVIEFHFFACSCPDLPTPFVEEAIFAPFYAPASFVKY